MTSALLHKKIKDALIKQRATVTASPQAARKFIISLGLGDLIEKKEARPSRRPHKK